MTAVCGPLSGLTCGPNPVSIRAMQFRQRRHVIQLIRTVYDPAIKRGRSEVVGRMDAERPELTDELRKLCSPEETREIETFLAEHRVLASRDAALRAARELPVSMRLAEAFFRQEQEQGPEAGALAAEILTAWADLKSSLRQAGFRKTKGR